MKKMLLAATFLSAVVFAQAQSETFKPFKFDISVGYAMPAGSGVKGGVLFGLEPKYAINDALAVGFKAEAAFTANIQDLNGNNESYDVKIRSVYQGTADYYFNTNGFRPFVGGGVGIMQVAGTTATPDNVDYLDESDFETSTEFAVTPRGGFEAGHFRMAAAYTIAANQSGYFAIKIGVFIGGGRR